MATKTKTRVSPSTKKALNELRKERARKQAEIAQERLERIRIVDQAFAERQTPYSLDQMAEVRFNSQRSRAVLRLQRSVMDAIRMGTHSRQITAKDGSPMHITVNFEEDPAGKMLKGWNNGNQLYIGINDALFKEATHMAGYTLSRPELCEMVMDALVGIGYHEIGHSVHSPNYQRLLNICAMKFRDEFDWPNWKQCLNALDDQRMETAQAIWSPNLARSFTSMVTLAITSDSRANLMHGRFYLPKAMQEEAESDYETVYGSDALQAMSAAVDAYLVAKSYDEMADAVAAYVAAVPEGGPSGFGEEHEQADVVDQDDDAGATDEQIAEDGEAIEGAMNKVGDSAGDKAPSNRAKNMAQEFQRSMQESNLGVMTAPENTMKPEHLAKAEALGHDIANRLRTAAAGNAHRWAERERQGIVNGFNYKTRTQRSDMNFFRGERGSASLGFDLDVVVLLDVSGSMSWWLDELSIMGHAVKAACDELGAHCMVGLYSETYVVLYGADDKADGRQCEVEGGTHPKMAFEDVANQRSDVRHEKDQLVIVMTDGMFSCPIAPYEDTNQHWIGVALDSSEGSEWAKTSSLRSNGFQETRSISDPIEVAAVLENWLRDTVVVTS